MYCQKCETEKDSSHFYPLQKSECKGCTKARVRRNYRKNTTHFKEYEKKRSTLPHRVKARLDYANKEQGRLRGNEAKKEYIRRNPEKRKAQVISGNAIRSGKLIRQPCVFCGETKVQGHHEDYSKPLDVLWLCTKHHAAVHRGKIQVIANPIPFIQHERGLL